MWCRPSYSSTLSYCFASFHCHALLFSFFPFRPTPSRLLFSVCLLGLVPPSPAGGCVGCGMVCGGGRDGGLLASYRVVSLTPLALVRFRLACCSGLSLGSRFSLACLVGFRCLSSGPVPSRPVFPVPCVSYDVLAFRPRLIRRVRSARRPLPARPLLGDSVGSCHPIGAVPCFAPSVSVFRLSSLLRLVLSARFVSCLAPRVGIALVSPFAPPCLSSCGAMIAATVPLLAVVWASVDVAMPFSFACRSPSCLVACLPAWSWRSSVCGVVPSVVAVFPSIRSSPRSLVSSGLGDRCRIVEDTACLLARACVCVGCALGCRSLSCRAWDVVYLICRNELLKRSLS